MQFEFSSLCGQYSDAFLTSHAQIGRGPTKSSVQGGSTERQQNPAISPKTASQFAKPTQQHKSSAPKVELSTAEFLAAHERKQDTFNYIFKQFAYYGHAEFRIPSGELAREFIENEYQRQIDIDPKAFTKVEQTLSPESLRYVAKAPVPVTSSSNNSRSTQAEFERAFPEYSAIRSSAKNELKIHERPIEVKTSELGDLMEDAQSLQNHYLDNEIQTTVKSGSGFEVLKVKQHSSVDKILTGEHTTQIKICLPDQMQVSYNMGVYISHQISRYLKRNTPAEICELYPEDASFALGFRQNWCGDNRFDLMRQSFIDFSLKRINEVKRVYVNNSLLSQQLLTILSSHHTTISKNADFYISKPRNLLELQRVTKLFFGSPLVAGCKIIVLSRDVKFTFKQLDNMVQTNLRAKQVCNPNLSFEPQHMIYIEPSQENDYDTYIWDNVGNFCDGALGKNTLVRSEVLRNASEIVQSKAVELKIAEQNQIIQQEAIKLECGLIPPQIYTPSVQLIEPFPLPQNLDQIAQIELKDPNLPELVTESNTKNAPELDLTVPQSNDIVEVEYSMETSFLTESSEDKPYDDESISLSETYSESSDEQQPEHIKQIMLQYQSEQDTMRPLSLEQFQFKYYEKPNFERSLKCTANALLEDPPPPHPQVNEFHFTSPQVMSVCGARSAPLLDVETSFPLTQLSDFETAGTPRLEELIEFNTIAEEQVQPPRIFLSNDDVYKVETRPPDPSQVREKRPNQLKQYLLRRKRRRLTFVRKRYWSIQIPHTKSLLVATRSQYDDQRTPLHRRGPQSHQSDLYQYLESEPPPPIAGRQQSQNQSTEFSPLTNRPPSDKLRPIDPGVSLNLRRCSHGRVSQMTSRPVPQLRLLQSTSTTVITAKDRSATRAAYVFPYKDDIQHAPIHVRDNKVSDDRSPHHFCSSRPKRPQISAADEQEEGKRGSPSDELI